MLNTKKEQKTLEMADIVSYFEGNVKQKKDFKIGLEYERLSLDKELKPVKYKDIARIIELFASIKNLEIIKDNGVIIGAKANDGKDFSLSLEPGLQMEFSFEPMCEIFEIERELCKNAAMIDNIARAFNVFFVPYGISPLVGHKDIAMLEKSRYLIMDEYFKDKGEFAPVMMRETAGVQVNFDYSSGADAILKLRACALLSPILTGLYANSKLHGAIQSDFKSFRANAWKHTDNARCGLFYKNLLKNRPYFSFEDYIENVLLVPMLFIERNGNKININGQIDFKTFMKNGFKGYFPTLDDYILHSSLTFPDVRLKNCLEIRNHDCQNIDLTLSICAFYKGILHSDSAIYEVISLLDFTPDMLDEYGNLSAKYGLNYEIEGVFAFDYAKKLFEISFKNLDEDEKKYLKPALDLIDMHKCPADFVDFSNFSENFML